MYILRWFRMHKWCSGVRPIRVIRARPIYVSLRLVRLARRQIDAGLINARALNVDAQLSSCKFSILLPILIYVHFGVFSFN